jgi:CMP-2-keto-3-deoxyoctulosonic acid synthetase
LWTEFKSLIPLCDSSFLERAEDLEQLRVLEAGFGIQVVEVENVLPGE